MHGWPSNGTSPRTAFSFETAIGVFDDPFAITAEDYIDDNGETRYQTIGWAARVLITVGHVHRTIDEIDTPRIITARKAVKYEQEVYWGCRGRTH